MKLILIDKNWKQDILIGTGLGIFFIFLNMAFPLVEIGFPNVAHMSSAGEQSIVVGVLAPIFEEFGFRCVLLGILAVVLPYFWLAVGVSSLAFSLFHWSVYGLALQSAFVGAFMFGIITAYVAKWTNSLLPVIVMHAIFNLYLLSSKLVFISW